MKRLAIMVLLALAACDAIDLGPQTVQVELQVVGPESADITYTTANSGQSQDTGAALPWSYEYTASSGEFYYVSAQNSQGGTITCKVTIDGVPTKSTDAHGRFAICTADGS